MRRLAGGSPGPPDLSDGLGRGLGAWLSPDEERVYDFFVVRLWREPASERLLRAEVEHVQGGEVVVSANADPEWVGNAIRRCLRLRGRGEGQAS